MGLFDWIYKRHRADITIPWSEKYSVGIVELDAQHRRLFELYNQLIEAMYRGESLKVLQDALNSLIEYVVVHFTTEEQYMQKYAYPEFDKHKKAHIFLRDKTLQIHRNFSEGKPVLTAEVITFLRNWLKDHVMNMDKKYSKHLKKMGAR